MTTSTSPDVDIREFAAAVRRRLDDLSPDEIDDLTDGLEADLHEQAATDDDHLVLHDPDGYADELRASAGLPARVTSGEEPVSLRARQRLVSYKEAVVRAVAASTFGAWVMDLLRSLRPVWWVLRGWAAYQLIALFVGNEGSLVPRSGVLWLLMFAMVVVSVQWGRGYWFPGKLLRVIKNVVSVLAILTLPFLLGAAVSQATAASDVYDSAPDAPPPGLYLDGQRVSNIFAFDADGELLDEVQLFDQDGDPLVTVGAEGLNDEFDYASGEDTTTVPYDGSSVGTGWNVYPLQVAPWNDYGTVDGELAEPATPPFRATYPTNNQGETPTPTPTPTSTP